MLMPVLFVYSAHGEDGLLLSADLTYSRMFFPDGLTGFAWGDWAKYTDSPLREFQHQRGAQALVGHLDPCGPFCRRGRGLGQAPPRN